jgi:hypothetical protein
VLPSVEAFQADVALALFRRHEKSLTGVDDVAFAVKIFKSFKHHSGY